MGEQGALQNQLKELEAKCKADFDCKIEDLPGFISQLKSEAEAALANAEVILGLREGTVKPAASTPVAAPKTIVRTAKPVAVAGDEDGIP
jgi:predicted RNase H-like HicB family nuclease